MTGQDHKHDDIGCLEAIEALYAYLDGELDGVSIEHVEKHMEHCRSCYSRRDVERALTEHLQRTGKAKAPASTQARLKKLIDNL